MKIGVLEDIAWQTEALEYCKQFGISTTKQAEFNAAFDAKS
jgi:hypothetical protein